MTNSEFSRRKLLHFGALDNCRVALCKSYDMELPAPPKARQTEFIPGGCWWYTYTGPAGDTPHQVDFQVAGEVASL